VEPANKVKRERNDEAKCNQLLWWRRPGVRHCLITFCLMPLARMEGCLSGSVEVAQVRGGVSRAESMRVVAVLL